MPRAAANRSRNRRLARPRSTKRLINPGYGSPPASHSFAYTLVAVKPGMVFNSFKCAVGLPEESSTRKSTRAIPSTPKAV